MEYENEVGEDTDTSTDTSTDTDTSTGEAGEGEEGEITLDDLLGAEFDDPALQGEHKGLPHYEEILKHIPENGRKLIQNLRASHTRKMQEIADTRRALAEERAELLRQREALSSSPAARALAEQAQKGLPEGVDPWSEEGLAALVEQKAAGMLQKMLAPMQEEVEVSRRKAELTQFKTDHPDLTQDPDIKKEVIAHLKANPDMRLETAYWAARGKVLSTRERTAQAAREKERADSRASLKTTSTGTRVVNGVREPKFKSAWDAYQHHQRNKA
jgi:hypothetical protein